MGSGEGVGIEEGKRGVLGSGGADGGLGPSLPPPFSVFPLPLLSVDVPPASSSSPSSLPFEYGGKGRRRVLIQEASLFLLWSPSDVASAGKGGCSSSISIMAVGGKIAYLLPCIPSDDADKDSRDVQGGERRIVVSGGREARGGEREESNRAGGIRVPSNPEKIDENSCPATHDRQARHDHIKAANFLSGGGLRPPESGELSKILESDTAKPACSWPVPCTLIAHASLTFEEENPLTLHLSWTTY